MSRLVVLFLSFFFLFTSRAVFRFPIIPAPLISVVRSSKRTIGWRKFSSQGCRQKLTRVSVFLTFAEINASNVERRRRRASRPMVLIKTDFIKSSWQRARNAAEVTSNTIKFFQTYTRECERKHLQNIDTRINWEVFYNVKNDFCTYQTKNKGRKLTRVNFFVFFSIKSRVVWFFTLNTWFLRLDKFATIAVNTSRYILVIPNF